MRRSIIAVLLLAIVAGIAWWLWHWQAGPERPADPWAAIHPEAVAVLEVPEPFIAWERFTGTSQFWGDLEGKPAFAALDTIMDRLARSGAIPSGKQKDAAPLLIAWRATESGTLIPVMCWPMVRSEQALSLLGEAFGTPVSAELWTGTRQSLQPDSALPAVELAWSKGLLLLGTDGEMVEEARSLAGSARKPDALFEKARASLSVGADAHLLIMPAFASQLLGIHGQGIFPANAPVEGWAALDIRFRPGAVLMNGLLFPAGESPATTAIREQRPAKPDIIRVLPTTVSDLRVIQISDPAAHVRAINGELPDDALFTAYAEWVRGGIGVAEASKDMDGDAQRWAVLETEDPAKATDAMLFRCPDGGCATTEYRGVRIIRMADPEALATLYGNAFAGFEQPLWAVLADMVVFSDTPAGMRAAIDAWTDRNSLVLDPRSGDFFQRFGSEAVYSWWVDVARTYTPGEGPLADAQRTLGGALLQLTPRNDGAFIATFCLQHAPAGKRAAGALWTTALPTPLVAPPILVKDYLSKTLQVFTQDKDNRISLISCTGKVLWQRQLDGPLIGGVAQIDRYRNGKLQMLCNTANKVYLIDRLGRDVEGFPVGLKSQASTPLSVFDYEGKKDYRIIVPMVDGGLLNLGGDGKPVQGWEPVKLSGPALAAVEHVRIKGKDFLVLALRNGKVAVLDRRGTVRYDAKLRMDRIQTFLGSREAMDIADRRMLWADSSGAVLSGKLDGTVDTLSPATSGKVALFDVDGDEHIEVLRTTISALTAESKGKVLFRLNFPDSPDAMAFGVPLEGEEVAIGLVLPEQDQVRLYDAAGELWPGFPLKGAVRSSVADINLDGVLELVTADGEGVVTVYALPAGR